MNRMDEYKNLLTETGTLPPALDDTVIHARVRAKKAKRVRRLFAIPGSSLAVFFTAFVVLVNISTTFALACSRIPFLRELAAVVSFSPSLSAAVENDYVQPVGLELTDHGMTMRIEYVIVDQKQLNIFYSLSSQVYTSVMVTPEISAEDGADLDGYTIWSSGREVPNEGFHNITVDFASVGDDMPDSLILDCSVAACGTGTEEDTAPAGSDPFNAVEPAEPETVAAFTFMLSFDPTFTQQGEVIDVDKSFVLDGQSMTVTTVEVYPTHIRLNVTGDEDNTAWLKSLICRLEDEDGNKYEQVGNGISATGTADMMSSYRLESSYFTQAGSLMLYITGAVWLDKDLARVKVNLADGTAESLPGGVALENSERIGGDWRLTFSGRQREENTSHRLFSYDYYDEAGNMYVYSMVMTGYVDENEQKTAEDAILFTEQFTLEGYPYDVVYLSPSFSHTTPLDTPITIHVN